MHNVTCWNSTEINARICQETWLDIWYQLDTNLIQFSNMGISEGYHFLCGFPWLKQPVGRPWNLTWDRQFLQRPCLDLASRLAMPCKKPCLSTVPSLAPRLAPLFWPQIHGVFGPEVTSWTVAETWMTFSATSMETGHGNRYLVGGWATPLKNMSQLGWWDSQLIWENKKWQPNHQPAIVTQASKNDKIAWTIQVSGTVFCAGLVWKIRYPYPRIPWFLTVFPTSHCYSSHPAPRPFHRWACFAQSSGPGWQWIPWLATRWGPKG